MDVEFKPFSELTRKQLKAIESVKQGKNGIELKLHSKTWSIERICKMLGFDAPTGIDLTTLGDKIDNKIQIEIIENISQVDNENNQE